MNSFLLVKLVKYRKCYARAKLNGSSKSGEKLSFLCRVFIFSTMIAYGVKVWEHHIDFGVKGQIYLKAVFWFIMVIIFRWSVFIFGNDAYGVQVTTKL